MPIPSFALPLRALSALFIAALAGCATVSTPPAPILASFVVLGVDGAAVARVVTSAAACPSLSIDRQLVPMRLRAPAASIAQRPTASARKESKAAEFPVITCEAPLPAGTASAAVQGQALPVPHAEYKRIVVIGDTGCRLKASDDAFQDCNDARAYPFATVARAAAAWKPDLVVHVGDLHYRENACPAARAGCAGSGWGYGWDAWRDDLFGPGASLLQAAPWVVARGNHESCNRAGQGYWRFIDPRPLLARRDCNLAADDLTGDYSEPYAIPLGGSAQLIVLDTSNTTHRGLAAGDVRYEKFGDTYRKMEALTHKADYNIGVNHAPLLAFGALRNAKGEDKLFNGDLGQQMAFGALNPGLLPPRVQLMLSGHVHLWEQLSFSSAHPSQFVSGFSGTEEDPVPLPASIPPGVSPAPGAVVEHLSSWVNGFGFMTMERSGADQWEVKIWNQHGELRNSCQVRGSKSVCEVDQVSDVPLTW